MHETFSAFQQVIVKILGDLANGKILKDFSSKYLLIPSLTDLVDPPIQYTV